MSNYNTWGVQNDTCIAGVVYFRSFEVRWKLTPGDINTKAGKINLTKPLSKKQKGQKISIDTWGVTAALKSSILVQNQMR